MNNGTSDHNEGCANGWTKTLVAPGHAEGTSGFVGTMAQAAGSPPNTQNLNKRQRLSRLLDKLSVQLQNNNLYPPTQHWPALNPPFQNNKPPADEPLDLSVKHEQPSPAPEITYTCETCGQTFTMHDRLAKHIASRHRNRTPEAARLYECEVCLRRFARSDMLTRHARLHSGLKPYSCSACGQVFSRSDHLATHQRTHTGEKPYRCPSCPYAACRRDMITRHMRTHSRRPQPA
ncbi:zinc finger protein 135 isoform X2 [Bombyx mori]|uniref:C2H2-type domain-containing protein n=1 Tax=Bombyx mori TaxID=7091 RepID=A0A8R2C9A5_BOMMO|nr:zinc finger protein 135 isoform X2 [Bombyx mori]